MWPADPKPTASGRRLCFAPHLEEKNASRESHNKCGSEGRHSAIQCCLTYKHLDTPHTGTRWLVNIAWPNTNLPMRLVANPNWRFFLPSAASQRARLGVFSSVVQSRHAQSVTLGTPEISTLRFAFCGFPTGNYQTRPNRNVGNPRNFNVTICIVWFP